MKKKHFMFISAFLFGLLIALGSCKDNKHRSYDDDDEDDEDDTEWVDDEDDDDDDDSKSKKQVALTKIERAEDLDDLDLDDLDLSDFKMEDIDFDNLDLESLSSEQADNLLKLAAAVASRELPEDLGDGMKMTAMNLEGRDVVFNIDMDMEKMGITMNEFSMALEMPEVKAEMMKSMFNDTDDDMAAFMKVIEVSKKNFVVRFIDSATGDSSEIKLTNSELTRAMNGQ